MQRSHTVKKKEGLVVNAAARLNHADTVLGVGRHVVSNNSTGQTVCIFFVKEKESEHKRMRPNNHSH